MRMFEDTGHAATVLGPGTMAAIAEAARLSESQFSAADVRQLAVQASPLGSGEVRNGTYTYMASGWLAQSVCD